MYHIVRYLQENSEKRDQKKQNYTVPQGTSLRALLLGRMSACLHMQFGLILASFSLFDTSGNIKVLCLVQVLIKTLKYDFHLQISYIYYRRVV